MSKGKLSVEEIEAMTAASGSEYDFDSDDSADDPAWIPEGLGGYDNDESDADNLSNVIEAMAMEEEQEDFNELLHDNEEEHIENIPVGVPKWSEYRGRPKHFEFVGKHGLQEEIPPEITPLQIYTKIVDQEVLDIISNETNRYAQQFMTANQREKYSRMNRWNETNPEEIKKFFGLMIWMGLVPLGRIESYWETNGVYNLALPRSVMPRNRFQSLLSMLHFSNNETADVSDRLRKISGLIELLQNKFQNIFFPEEDFVIDETLVPWRGRLIFRQYIPNKTHRYGVKLFKLCSIDGYTWALKVYAGKSATGEREVGLARNVCMELSKELLNEGRCLYVDNFYMSYELAQELLQKQTHVVGTLRANKKNIPKDVLLAKLARGDIISREDENGIVILKWKDTRDVRMLSTKHAPELQPVTRRNRPSKIALANQPSTSANPPIYSRPKQRGASFKPAAILAYNKGKSGIDLSDQMGSYASTLRKGIKWYRKLGIELLLGVGVVNAWVLYKHATKAKINIRNFREMLVAEILDIPTAPIRIAEPRTKTHHLLNRTSTDGKKLRRKCSICYTRITNDKGREAARKEAKQIFTYCDTCPDQPQMCRDCFNSKH